MPVIVENFSAETIQKINVRSIKKSAEEADCQLTPFKKTR